MRNYIILLFLALSSVCRAGGDGVALSRLMAHDPVLAREAGQWHLFCTGMGIDHWTSSDMLTWHHAARVFATPPEWAARMVPGYRGHTWAPDIIFHQGLWHIFYSCSAFGKNTSAIGHATSPTLFDARWTDRGCVIQSVPGRDDWNAIDPNIAFDEAGTPWLCFGSFWSGIKIVRMRPDLSALSEPEEWHAVARRSEGKAIEAPFIMRHGGRYYLFVSWDYCCRGAKSDYKVVVGRAEKITGPYLDRDGVPMDRGGGTLVTDGRGQWHGIGHNAAYTFHTGRAGEAEDYYISHAYNKDDGSPRLVIKRIKWTKDGWPELRKL